MDYVDYYVLAVPRAVVLETCVEGQVGFSELYHLFTHLLQINRIESPHMPSLIYDRKGWREGQEIAKEVL